MDSRAERVRAIRVALGDTQRQFADRMSRAAEALGFAQRYTENAVSKIEGEYRDTALEDVAVLEAIDPERRGWHWIAFGRTPPAETPVVMPEPLASDEKFRLPRETFEHEARRGKRLIEEEHRKKGRAAGHGRKRR